MKALLGLVGAGVVLTFAGIEGFSGGMASVAALAGVACWVVSGWIID